MRIRPLAVPPILLAAALMAPGACGQASTDNTDDFTGAQRDVARAVYDFRDAIARRDEAKICDAYFTGALRDEIVRVSKQAGRGTTCASAVQDSIQDIDATDITIPKDGITISGDTATVRITTDLTGDTPDPTDTLTLTDERGWRISKLPSGR